MTETLEVTQGQGEALPEIQPVELMPTDEPAKEEIKETKVRDETGKFTKKNSLDDAVKKAAEQLKDKPADTALPNAEAAPVVDEFKAPDHWPADTTALYNTLPPEAKKIYLEAAKKLEAGYTKRNQEQAGRIKYGEVVEQRAKGAAPEQVAGFIDYYSTLEQGFNKDPIKVIEFLAQQKGIDLKKHYGGSQAPSSADDLEFKDPVIEALQQQVTELSGKLNARETNEKQHNDRALQDHISSFANAKDEAGNPKHPHFERLRLAMKGLLDAGISADLDEAYDRALRIDPDLSKQLEQDKEAKLKAEWEAARKADLDKARRNSTHLSGSAPVRTSSRGKTVEEAFQLARQQTGH